MGDRDLRASLGQIGPQISGLEYAGELVDGRKKARMCADLGVAFPIHIAKTLQEACSILWLRHELRAIELAGEHRTILELAHLCGATTTAIAKVVQAQKPRVSHQRKMRFIEDVPYRKLKKTEKMIRRLITLEPELYAYGREAAAQLGHKNFNKLVRDALWAKVALIVPSCPLFQPRRVQPPNGARAPKRRTG
jgi:hypothetical protein